MNLSHPSQQAQVACRDLTIFRKMKDQLWLKGPCRPYEEVIYLFGFFYYSCLVLNI